MCVCVCAHPDSNLRALVNVSDCKAGGRGTHTDSSANKAGLYAVRISLRTLSDVPAYGNGNQAKPQTWQAEGKGCMSVAANMLPGTCTGVQVYPSSTRSSPESVSGGVDLYSVCGFVATGNTRSCELPGCVVRPIMVP